MNTSPRLSRLRAGMLKAAATTAVTLTLVVPTLGAAGAAHADEGTAPVAELTQVIEAAEPVEAVEAIVPDPADAQEAPAPEPADAVDPIVAAAPVTIVAVDDHFYSAPTDTFTVPYADLYLNDSDPTAVYLDFAGDSANIWLANGLMGWDVPAGFVGDKVFQYRTQNSAMMISNYATITITIAPAPVAVADVYSTPTDTALLIAAPGILVNDSANSTVASSDDLTGETAVFNDGTFSYTPPAGFTGTKTLNYRVSQNGILSNYASITITVGDPVAPVAPVAVNDKYTMTMDTTLIVLAPGVLSNDTPGAPANSMSGVYPGVSDLDANGNFMYTPPVGFTGTAVVNYTIMQNGIQSNLASITVEVVDPTASSTVPDPLDEPGEPGGTSSTVPGGETPGGPTVGSLAHAGATTAWLVTPAAGILLLGCLVLGFAAHRRRTAPTA